MHWNSDVESKDSRAVISHRSFLHTIEICHCHTHYNISF